jgi:hypothetical protein
LQRSCKLQQPLANYRAAFARRRSGVRILLLEGELDEAQGRSLFSLAPLWQIRWPRFAQGGAAALAEGLRHRGGGRLPLLPPPLAPGPHRDGGSRSSRSRSLAPPRGPGGPSARGGVGRAPIGHRAARVVILVPRSTSGRVRAPSRAKGAQGPCPRGCNTRP